MDRLLGSGVLGSGVWVGDEDLGGFGVERKLRAAKGRSIERKRGD